jgi:hypothetical protein
MNYHMTQYIARFTTPLLFPFRELHLVLSSMQVRLASKSGAEGDREGP